MAIAVILRGARVRRPIMYVWQGGNSGLGYSFHNSLLALLLWEVL